MKLQEPNPPTPFPKREGGARKPPSLLGKGVGGLGLLLLAFAIWYFAIRTPEPRDDFGRFQGEWRLTVADRAKHAPIAVRVTGDKWVYLVGDKDQKRYAMTLRPDANPKEIDLVLLLADDSPVLVNHDGIFTPVTLRGIYTIEGGKAKLATAPSALPRPTSFDAPDGGPVLVLERP